MVKTNENGAFFKLDDVSVSYGQIEALKGVTVEVGEGEIVSLIGANGAGKSTTLMTISGILKPKKGKKYFDGEDVTDASADGIVGRGIVQVPEGRRIFPRMSVQENLEMGAFRRHKADTGTLDHVFELFPILKERRGQKGGTLSGGEQQMLAIARSLMAEPRLLLLDEPSLGLAPKIVEDIFATINRINSEGITVFLVEQNAAMALDVSHRGYVMETGKVVLQDTSANLLENEEVQKAYLGG
ncbi:MAG: ABC transporter ATP-binding protein [Candidatus Coatesbacteria bacterium]|nr:MAG: ABC transporter ATP-binding protein [Candidatus Coatesbacteria bacterium]